MNQPCLSDPPFSPLTLLALNFHLFRGYNGKLTYQANLIKLAPHQVQERHQKLSILRAKFLESRKQRLCLVLPGSLKPPPPSPSPSLATANFNSAGLGSRSSFTALDHQGALLGQNSLALGNAVEHERQ